MSALLRVQHLSKEFTLRRGLGRGKSFRAVDDVSFEVIQGEVLGLVGESGCGKSTLARSITRLHRPSAGSILFDGTEIADLPMARLRPLRREIQLIFQDPFASLNPRKRIGACLEQALALHGIGKSSAERRQKVTELLAAVGLPASHAERYPAGLSGGQRQRIGIARALALSPRLVVADEPVSALDVSVQAEILNLLADLRSRLGLTVVFISHDLGVIRHVSDRIGVMYLGRLVELAPAEAFFAGPLHPYSAALLASVPRPEPDQPRRAPPLSGDPPSPLSPPEGCRFHPRCPRASAICRKITPELSPSEGGRMVACHHPLYAGEDPAHTSAPNPGPEGASSSQISAQGLFPQPFCPNAFSSPGPLQDGAAGRAH